MTRIPIGIVVVGLCFLSGCFELKAQTSSERARTELQLGVDAYKETNYSEAIQHFQLALTADPDFHTARLYLASTLAQECIPGLKTAENDMYCNGSISQFQQVLEHDPVDLAALKAIASLCFNLQKLDEAKEYQRKVMEVDPHDPEAPYAIAVLDWTQSYKRRMNAKDQAGLKPEDPFITETECSKLRTENLPIIEEAMEMLSTALTLRPDYDDAMAYMNLVYRERADTNAAIVLPSMPTYGPLTIGSRLRWTSRSKKLANSLGQRNEVWVTGAERPEIQNRCWNPRPFDFALAES